MAVATTTTTTTATTSTSTTTGRKQANNGAGGLGHRRAAPVGSKNSSWYTKYEYYPPYCGTPKEMATRQIPSLPTTSKAGETRLLHATVIIRHGARTPWDIPHVENASLNCWPDYNPIWNCDLTTWISTPPRAGDGTDSSNNGNGNGNGMFWMNKEYTALHDPQENLKNAWGGTCQHGQLLLQGYDQELQNGKFLRDAYVYQGDNDSRHDQQTRTRLINAKTIFDKDSSLKSNIYYRSDDDQRTLMSGQIVLHGMLQDELNQYSVTHNGQHPILSLHVADRERDILDANQDLCPRLGELRERFHKSADYKAFLESNERQLLMALKQHELDGGTATLDCLMTTICTDRDLPEKINDYKGEPINVGDYSPHQPGTPADNISSSAPNSNPSGTSFEEYGDNLFWRLARLGAMPTNLLNTANGGEYAKLSMGPLWREIMHHITAAYDKSYTPDPKDPTPAKLALFSGHDTTILPLMASLGVWNISRDFWPPYASMMIIEVHQVLNLDATTTDMTVYPTDYAFRLLYNGQVITPRIPNCPAEPEHLCDLDVLLHMVKPLLHWDCSLQYPTPQTYNDPVSQAQEILRSQGGQWVMGMVALSSFVVGMLFTITCVCCCCPNKAAEQITKRGATRTRHLVASSDEDGMVMDGYSDDPADDNNALGNADFVIGSSSSSCRSQPVDLSEEDNGGLL